MEHFRPLSITNLSAFDLKHVTKLSKMKVYAVVSISGDPFMASNSSHITPEDSQGETNPSWNILINYTLHDPSLQSNRLLLDISFRCKGTFKTHDVGRFGIPVKKLFDASGRPDTCRQVEFLVSRPSGKTQGVVRFSFAFGKSYPWSGPESQPQPPYCNSEYSSAASQPYEGSNSSQNTYYTGHGDYDYNDGDSLPFSIY